MGGDRTVLLSQSRLAHHFITSGHTMDHVGVMVIEIFGRADPVHVLRKMRVSG